MGITEVEGSLLLPTGAINATQKSVLHSLKNVSHKVSRLAESQLSNVLQLDMVCGKQERKPPLCPLQREPEKNRYPQGVATNG